MKSKSEIIERIKKCLRKADPKRNNNPHEIELAMSMVNRLLREHDLSMSEIQFEDGKLVSPIVEEESSINKKMPQWKKMLLNVVLILCPHVEVIESAFKNNLIFIGTREDVALFVKFYKHLARVIGSYIGVFHGHRPSYARGIVTGLYHRASSLREENNAANDSSSGMALMIVKGKEVEAYFKNKYPSVKPRKLKKTDYDRMSFARGISDSSQVDLSPHEKVTNVHVASMR